MYTVGGTGGRGGSKLRRRLAGEAGVTADAKTAGSAAVAWEAAIGGGGEHGGGMTRRRAMGAAARGVAAVGAAAMWGRRGRITADGNYSRQWAEAVGSIGSGQWAVGTVGSGHECAWAVGSGQ